MVLYKTEYWEKTKQQQQQQKQNKQKNKKKTHKQNKMKRTDKIQSGQRKAAKQLQHTHSAAVLS